MTQMKNEIENIGEIAQVPAQAFAQSALIGQHHNLINVVEIIAFEKVYDVMARIEVCNCPRCVSDVLAIALNALPTKYVTSDAGKQYIQLNACKKQFETDVVFALIKASLIVKSSPKHDLK